MTPRPLNEYKYGEFYVASQYANDKAGASSTAPHFEVNYGILPNVQLHLIAPFGCDRPRGGPTLYGFQDLELGVKYRFIQESDYLPVVDQREIVKWLTLGTELFYQTPLARYGEYQTGYTVGAIINLTQNHHVLCSIGSDIHGPSLFSYCVGYQYTWAKRRKTARKRNSRFKAETSLRSFG
jgi:hypothetical protein